jgi:hypothetical protein
VIAVAAVVFIGAAPVGSQSRAGLPRGDGAGRGSRGGGGGGGGRGSSDAQDRLERVGLVRIGALHAADSYAKTAAGAGAVYDVKDILGIIIFLYHMQHNMAYGLCSDENEAERDRVREELKSVTQKAESITPS